MLGAPFVASFFQVENIKRAQNPIGMAINRIRTIERESGRPKARRAHPSKSVFGFV